MEVYRKPRGPQRVLLGGGGKGRRIGLSTTNRKVESTRLQSNDCCQSLVGTLLAVKGETLARECRGPGEPLTDAPNERSASNGGKTTVNAGRGHECWVPDCLASFKED